MLLPRLVDTRTLHVDVNPPDETMNPRCSTRTRNRFLAKVQSCKRNMISPGSTVACIARRPGLSIPLLRGSKAQNQE